MGVLQVAPDAPAAGGPPAGRAAVARGRTMISEGADIIEVVCAPAASGRPPAHPVMEARQVRAVVSTLMSDVRIAVRTGSATVAAAAVGAGATLITDLTTAPVTAAGEDSLAALAAEAGAGWVAVAGPGTRPGGGGRSGSRPLVADLAGALRARAEAADAAGVKEIYIDPGIGSGRPLEDDLELLGGLEQLAALDRPLVAGTGDGRLIDALHAAADTATSPARALDGTNSGGAAPDDDRLEGALAAAVWAMLAGAAIVRTHHVAATTEAARTVGAKAPAGAP